MKRLCGFYEFEVKYPPPARRLANSARFVLLILFLSVTAWNASAQTVKWTDSFVKDQAPSLDQCQNWDAFLSELSDRQFSVVKFYGSNDPAGVTLSDPVAASKLADLLSKKEEGSVESGGNVWSVKICGSSLCEGPSVTLAVNGSTSSCDCADSYVIRPHASNKNWGGINVASSCAAASQSFSLEFEPSVSITADGPTSLCVGGQVTLTAQAFGCSDPTFTWSNGVVGNSITVTEPGDYYVEASGDGCSGTSESVNVTMSDISVQAGEDVTICEEPVALSAIGTSGVNSGIVTEKVCLLDVRGGECSKFTNSICVDGGEAVTNKTLTHDFTAANPVALRFQIYYSSSTTNGTFSFKVNGEEIHSFVETKSSGGACIPAADQYPRSIAIPSEKFKKIWKDDAANAVSVEFTTPSGRIILAGAKAEIDYSNESYSWLPVEGLDDPSSANPIATPAQSTTYTVTYRDAQGCSATDEVRVNVQCSFPPVAVCKDVTVSVGENCQAMVEASAFDAGSTTDKEGELTFTVAPVGPYPIGTTDVILTVTDEDGESSTCEAKVTVTNESPVITSVTPSTSSLYANFPVSLSVAYTDNNIANATIDWGDGSVGEIVESPASVFEVDHTYMKSGSYSVTINMTDECEASTYVYHSIIVMDNLRGTVTGGGWFDSPEGAYFLKPRTAGKATFAFEASNSSRKAGPEGHVVFNFKDGNIKFRSTDVEWMHVEEETAIVQAAGRLNGKHGYQILISVVDEDKDRDDEARGRKGSDKKDKRKGEDDKKDKDKKRIDLIRVQITDPAGEVIYDSQPGAADVATATTQLGGGSINIKKTNSGVEREYDSPVASSFGGESSSIYPNPFSEWVDVQFNSASQENVVILVMDLSGKIVFNRIFEPSEDGVYSLDIFKEGEGRPGIYIVVIKQGKRVEFLRVVAD